MMKILAAKDADAKVLDEILTRNPKIVNLINSKVKLALCVAVDNSNPALRTNASKT